jgi:nitrile hydratase
MNGIHDMGGMHGMGPIEAEPNEPVFHHPWEGRVFALRRAMGAWRKWNIDVSRHEVELVPAADYLRLSYYERQFTAFVVLLQKRGFITLAELEGGTSAPAAVAVPALSADKAAELIVNGVPTSREVPVAPRFRTGQRVRARNDNPPGHTREPRYVRDKLGFIHRDHGVFVFPDTNARSRGEKPQHVYSVRFAARELWGPHAAEQDSVYVDLWDDSIAAPGKPGPKLIAVHRAATPSSC